MIQSEAKSLQGFPLCWVPFKGQWAFLPKARVLALDGLTQYRCPGLSPTGLLPGAVGSGVQQKESQRNEPGYRGQQGPGFVYPRALGCRSSMAPGDKAGGGEGGDQEAKPLEMRSL